MAALKLQLTMSLQWKREILTPCLAKILVLKI
jgi:hypothetical protein